MPRAPDRPAKPLEWSHQAREALDSTLALIAGQDRFTARLVKDRVDRALKQIAVFPEIGTPAARPGERRFAIPGTGHVINYRVIRGRVRVQLWYRARQMVRR